MKALSFLFIFFLPCTLRLSAQSRPDSLSRDSVIARMDYCTCDSLLPVKQSWSVYDQTSGNATPITGYYRFDHVQGKSTAKCGKFKDGMLSYGFLFVYDENGMLIETRKYYDSRYVGSCHVQE
ncbi:MAG TPA: hypothetical protein VFU15_06940 [Bacteroidia bacterium]|nr:hypothetical protein [Bacteroidia bacterium]